LSLYVVLDGPDGCGKSTQAAALAEWLRAGGRDVLHLREPGSTPLGERLRALLLDPATGDLRALTEVLLFSAARAELVAQVIAPALQRGTVVVVERGFTSTLCYQCLVAGEVEADADWFLDLTRRVHGASLPQVVFVLDVPTELAQQRTQRRQRDRFEARAPDHRARVRAAFLRLPTFDPSVQVVDGARDIDAVQNELRQRLARFLS
jgi:dTMP kinase